MLKNLARIGLTASLSVAMGISGTSLASATEFRAPTIGDIVSDAVPDSVPAPGPEVELNKVNNLNVATSETATVTIADLPAAAITVSQTGESGSPPLTIGLPAEAAISAAAESSGAAALSFDGAHTKTVVQPFTNALRLSTVLEDETAPTRYTYRFPDHVMPRLTRDGSVVLESTFDLAAEGDIVTIGYGTVGAPWAVDAKGAPVATHYEVSSGALVQVVEVNATTVFPVVADPTFWWGWNAFISNSAHQRVLKLMMLGAGAVAIANLFVSYIPNPYVQLAVRLASAVAIAGVAMWNYCNLNGRGVIVGQSWLANGIPLLPGTAFVRMGFFCLPQ